MNRPTKMRGFINDKLIVPPNMETWSRYAAIKASAVSAAESLFVAFETRAGENRLRPYTAAFSPPPTWPTIW